MSLLAYLLTVAHLIGLVLCVGAASVKLLLLLRARTNAAFVPTYLEVVRPITRELITGMALLTLSGIGWLLLGYPFTTLLVVKLALVVAGWVIGGTIDKVAEPAFRHLAPATGSPATPEFLSARNRYLALESAATVLFYVIILTWVTH